MDKKALTYWLNVINKYAALIMYPLSVLGSFIFRILQALIYAAIGLFFASRCNSTRSYGQLLRLSAVAVTPCIITKTILNFAHINIPFAPLWYFFAAMALLYFGIKAASQINHPADQFAQPYPQPYPQNQPNPQYQPQTPPQTIETESQRNDHTL